MYSLVSLLSVSTVILPVMSSNLFTEPNALSTNEYDYVIVGGGTAGCVLAARLTEDPHTTVLLVEAGGIPDFATAVPFLAPTLLNTVDDWNFTTTPQAGYGNRSIAFERGHVLGGSSSVNLLTYNRGSNDVWNRYAVLTDDLGWSWDAVEKYYLRSSRLVPPADDHNTDGEVLPAAHGHGPVEVSVPGFPTPLDAPLLQVTKEASFPFGFNIDLNRGDSVGFSFMQSSIGKGERSSAYTAYLAPLVNNRDNLQILINTQATKLVESSRRSTEPELRTVELTQKSQASVKVTAKREVILSTGVVGTPQLLMLSGIGPEPQLKKLGIETLVNLPDVGENLQDQPLVPMYFESPSDVDFEAVFLNPNVSAADLIQWNSTRQGPFVDSPANIQGFMTLPSDSSIFKQFQDPSAGPGSGNLEIIAAPGFLPLSGIPFPTTGNFITALALVVSVLSTGTVTLNSTDPFDKPLINPNYLTHSFDTFAMTCVMRNAMALYASPQLNSLVGQPTLGLATNSTDEELLAYARANSVTVNHASGTAHMSPVGAKFGVVDPDLRLKGVKGVRVVDASVLPRIPECHPQGLVYIVAERAADLIRATYPHEH